MNTTGHHNHSHLQLQQTKESATKEDYKDFDFEKIWSAGGEILVCPVFYFIFSLIVVDILLKITKALGIETKGTNQAISIFSAGCTLFQLLLQLLSGRRQNVHFFLMRYFIALY